MTSRSLSFSERYRNHKKYITRTLWTSIIGFFLMAVYYILGEVLLISRTVNYARVYNQSDLVLQHYKYNAVGRILGFEQLGFVITVFIAIAFAFQGFSYVFDQRKLDFYLSQPTTRAQRFWKNYSKAFSTYIIMYSVVEILAIIIAFVMGSVNTVVLATALLEFFRNIILFFAIYNISVLAILLCGTFPIAICVLMFLLGMFMVLGAEIYYFKTIFYATFSYKDGMGIVASPLYDRITTYSGLKYMTNKVGYYWNYNGFFNSLNMVIPGTIDTLLTGVAALILSVVFSRMRRLEHAGKTIVYSPFRWFVKIIVCVIVGLAAGIFVYLVYDSVWDDAIFILMLIIMLASTVACGCVIEAILEGSIKKLFAGKAQTLMALALVAFVYVIFKGDLLGYDSYVPRASRIKSCAIANNYGNYMFMDEYLEMSGDYMEITDTETFTKIAQIGMKAQKEYSKKIRNNEYDYQGWSDIDITYRLDNGRNVFRRITIPYDVEQKLMASLVDSKEYKEGYFAVFHDDDLREADKTALKRYIAYSTPSAQLSTANMPYQELSDAYRKDILENYSFDMARNNLPIGSVEYTAERRNEEGYVSTFANYSLEIYESYTNTIELLKKYGIYSDSTLDVECIESIRVTNYYPGMDLSKIDKSDIGMTDIESKDYTYKDKEKIMEILDNSMNGEYYGQWFDYRGSFDEQYGIEVTLVKPRDQYGSNTVHYNFKLGKVPEFVKADTN